VWTPAVKGPELTNDNIDDAFISEHEYGGSKSETLLCTHKYRDLFSQRQKVIAATSEKKTLKTNGITRHSFCSAAQPLRKS
jgi:hypothetical protein